MGTATMQIARLAGATVIATTRSMTKEPAMMASGADYVLDVGAEDIGAQIKRLTKGQGVDHAVEFTGSREILRLCIDAMRLGGSICPVGGETMELPLRVSDLVGKELNVLGVRASTRNDQRIITELVEKGRVRVPIHTVMQLSKIAAAHELLESGGIVGRIVLHPWDH